MKLVYPIIAVATLSMAGAWLLPGSLWCAILGWIAAFSTLLLLKQKHPVRCAYITGLLVHFAAFYWLCETISTFSGLPKVASVFLFILFCIISALQYLAWAWLARVMLQWCGFVAPVLAWLLAEIVAIRIFPWTLGHTQLAWTPMVQIANIGGAGLITAVMFLLPSSFLFGKIRSRVFCSALVVATLWYGNEQIKYDSSLNGSAIQVAVVQGDISPKEKHDIRSLDRNVQLYKEMSVPFEDSYDLIIWPETTILRFIPVGSRNAQLSGLPFSGRRASYLVGALSYLSEEEIFNSAFLIGADGQVLDPYHKQVLIPFGEFTPGLSWFPWLRKFNQNAAEFSRGKAPAILQVKRGEQELGTVSPLICYEDVVPRLAAKAANNGANILVNMSNDAWFGKSVAAKQHHLIASFRAIETGRYLIRSTNTGYTAIVNPLGQTVSDLPEWTQGALAGTIYSRSTRTTFLKIN